MPIRFACEHCNSVLSVSSRKAGQEVTCPKCRQKTPVPLPERVPVAASTKIEERSAAPAAGLSPKAAVAPRETPAIAPPPPPDTPSVASEALTQVELPDTGWQPPPTDDYDPYDTGDEVTWVFEGPSDTTNANAGTIDFNRVSLPRFVLYGQGALLLVVAVVALSLGILIGRGSAPKVVAKSSTPTPCYLTGTIEQRIGGSRPVADGGAVVIVVPQDQRPTDKAPIEGLRPDDPLPSAEQPSLVRIKAIGGDYARADDQGFFKVRVPDSGEYFLLIVSHHVERTASQRLDPVHLAQMGRYFLPAPDLVGDRAYQWRSESIKRDKQYAITFE